MPTEIIKKPISSKSETFALAGEDKLYVVKNVAENGKKDKYATISTLEEKLFGA